MQQDDPAIVITQLLGRITSDSPGVLCQGSPYGNSTRWVFDVSHDTVRARDFEFQLKTWHDRGVFAPVVSFSLTPLSWNCWDAKPFIEQPRLPRVRINIGSVFHGKILYRVALDLVHSTSR